MAQEIQRNLVSSVPSSVLARALVVVVPLSMFVQPALRLPREQLPFIRRCTHEAVLLLVLWQRLQ